MEGQYVVIISRSYGYAVYPAGVELPYGWQRIGSVDTKKNCYLFIRELESNPFDRKISAGLSVLPVQ